MQDHLESRVLKIVRAHFAEHERPGTTAPEITTATSLAELDVVDSLDCVEILMAIDDELGVDLLSGRGYGLGIKATVADLCDLIREHAGQRA